MIMEMYPAALDCGITPEAFWGYSMFEVRDLIESHNRVRRRQVKESISLAWAQAEQTAACLASMYGEGRPPQVWDVFPELFEEERREYEQKAAEDQMEAYKERRRAYVEEFNRRRRQ